MPAALLRRPSSLGLAALLVWSGVACGRPPAARPELPPETRPGATDSTAPSLAWRDLGPVPGILPRRVLRWPTLTALGEDLLFTANAIFPDSGADRALLQVGTVSGASLGRPAGAFLFGHARAAAHTHSGAFHLVWAESDETDTPPGGWPSRYSALWHSVYVHGRWSAPVRILEAHSIGWAPQAAPLAIDAAGCVHVVVPVFGDERQGLYHARGACAPWTVARIAPRGTYGAVTATDEGALFVALTGLDMTSPFDRNIVQVLRSGADGSWAHVARVQLGASGDRPQQVWIEARGRRLHLAWLQVLDRAGSVLDSAGRVRDRGGSVFVHVTSDDGGTRWADTVMSAPVAGAVFGARYVVHRCGALALFETTGDGSAFIVHELDLQRHRARSQPVFPRSDMSFEPAPAVRRDTLLLIAGLLEAGSDTSVAHLASRPACHDAVIH